MSGQGISQIVFYAIVLVALGYPLGLYMARVYTVPRVAGRVPRVDRARLLPGRPHGPEARAGLEELRQDRARLQRGLLVVLYAIQRLQGHLFLNPDHIRACRRTCR